MCCFSTCSFPLIILSRACVCIRHQRSCVAVVSFKVLWVACGAFINNVWYILIHSVVMMISSVVLVYYNILRGLDGGLYRSTRTVSSIVYLYSYIVWEHKSDGCTQNSYAQYNIYNILHQIVTSINGHIVKILFLCGIQIIYNILKLTLLNFYYCNFVLLF